MKLLRLFLLVLPIANGFSTAKADLLFLDLNYSSKEVEAARIAAKARGENLVVVPDLDALLTPAQKDDFLKYVAQARAAAAKANETNLKLNTLSGTSDQKKKDQAQKEVDDAAAVKQKAFDAVSAVMNQYKKANPPIDIGIDTAKIDRAVEGIHRNKKDMSSLIISSHHIDDIDGFATQGDNITLASVIHSIRRYPDMADHLNSVYGFGCYMMNMDGLKLWKKSFKNINVFAGWRVTGPTEDRPIDVGFLSGVLAQEGAFSAAKNNDEAKKKLLDFFNTKNIPDLVNSTAALCVKDTYVTYDQHKRVVTDVKNFKCKSEAVDQGNQAYSMIQKYMNAEEGYEDPAKDSAARGFYNKFREVDHCPEFSEEKKEVPSMLALIYFKGIVKNFNTYYQKDIAALKNPTFPDLSEPSLNRGQILSKINTFIKAAEDSKYPVVLRLSLAAQYILKDLRMASGDGSVDGFNSAWLEPTKDVKRLKKGLTLEVIR